MVVLYYNEELLEAAGVEPPSKSPDDRWTWEELREAAEATQDAGATYGFQIFRVSQIFQMQPLAESLGGGSGMNTETDPHEPDLTNDGWVESMEFFQELHEDGISPRGVAVVVISFLVPFDAVAVPLATQFREFGLANSYTGLVLPGVGHGLVTTVYGDTTTRAKVAARVLEMLGEADVPVAAGEASPLSGSEVFWAGHEGQGYGDLSEIGLPGSRDSALELIGHSLDRFGSDLVIAAIGPLTNVRLA
ncbi:extracellular solute-binding protein [Nesterenkonia sp. MY13]|uniref:Extracellular solute-binding protein n=1 Tax=Nesterenkonia sedimenti TaxID=1463632 RepID=A0A7X8TIL6_9MICC|nr:extracellular solute-binding protein [Nesterenkonia sedimenti]